MARILSALLATTLTLGLGVASFAPMEAEAAKVYRWVDEDGKVHYGDKKDKEEAEDTGLRSEDTDPREVQKRIEERKREIAKQEAKQGIQQRSEARDEAWRKEQERRCERARKWLEKVTAKQRLYTTDDQGNRDFVDTEEREKMVADARQRVADECDPLD